MPGRNRTGPMGQGPMTGKGFGFCAGNYAAGNMNRFGNGFGRGFCRGFGWRWQQMPTPANVPQANIAPDETQQLEQQVAELREQVANLEARLAE